MNLIEQLGNYDKAKEWDENRQVGSVLADVYHSLLTIEFLEYEQNQNISISLEMRND